MVLTLRSKAVMFPIGKADTSDTLPMAFHRAVGAADGNELAGKVEIAVAPIVVE